MSKGERVQTLLEVYADAVRQETGVPPPQATQRQARQVVSDLLEEGYDAHTVELACRLAGERADHALGIADQVPRAHQLLRDIHDLPSPAEALARARAYVAENGWPSGVRFVHSGIAGTYIRDVLGQERSAPYDVPGARRPSLSEIARALAETPA